MEESTSPSTRLGGDERLVPMADESVAAFEATADNAGSSGVEAVVVGITPKSRAEKPVVLEEQTALLEVSEGMVGPGNQPPSSQVVPPAAVEHDEVEEIERNEP